MKKGEKKVKKEVKERKAEKEKKEDGSKIAYEVHPNQ